MFKNDECNHHKVSIASSSPFLFLSFFSSNFFSYDCLNSQVVEFSSCRVFQSHKVRNEKCNALFTIFKDNQKNLKGTFEKIESKKKKPKICRAFKSCCARAFTHSFGCSFSSSAIAHSHTCWFVWVLL